MPAFLRGRGEIKSGKRKGAKRRSPDTSLRVLPSPRGLPSLERRKEKLSLFYLEMNYKTCTRARINAREREMAGRKAEFATRTHANKLPCREFLPEKQERKGSR